MGIEIRDYVAADEDGWLRCRVLAFLGTSYFDAVEPRKPAIAEPGFSLVAVADGAVVGLMDVAVEDHDATIESVAVHPDRRSEGIARALLDAAVARLTGTGVTVLDAWTREDPGTLAWYRATGFTESDHYLHVYADLHAHPEEPDRAIGSRRPGLRPVKAFLHAKLEDEARLREEFARVHVCRRFALPIPGRAASPAT
ncbi:GNAT family N-acetyltransferase [Glycomyces mayteni]|uniref:GNAT family N-acetyltransferase n=1 Tax=Glycomyces mayteni TaxID=543887 RepID=A0ABW2DAJ5_9ACTN|nr:GNAT family N-acetyltransferase [Glycomyces mayteni]